MADVQIGTTNLPISIQPRINGEIVTQEQIKLEFSNSFIDDSTTPLTWTLEYTERDGTTQTQFFDTGESTNDTIVFAMPDSFYAEFKVWMVTIRWNIAGVAPRPEQIFSNESIMIEVKDLTLGL